MPHFTLETYASHRSNTEGSLLAKEYSFGVRLSLTNNQHLEKHIKFLVSGVKSTCNTGNWTISESTKQSINVTRLWWRNYKPKGSRKNKSRSSANSNNINNKINNNVWMLSCVTWTCSKGSQRYLWSLLQGGYSLKFSTPPLPPWSLSTSYITYNSRHSSNSEWFCHAHYLRAAWCS